MGRIRVHSHAEFTGRFPAELPSGLEVRTRSGQRLVERALYPKGHARNPMTDADVSDKFRALAADALPPPRLDPALDALWRIGEQPRVRSLLDRLLP
jgi:2-methylcitrate dehydratase